MGNTLFFVYRLAVLEKDEDGISDEVSDLNYQVGHLVSVAKDLFTISMLFHR